MLVGHAKAGTVFLKTRYELQIQALKNKRRSLKDRLGVSQPLGIEAQAKYYSSWIYAATHALISLPGRWDASRLARRLRISVDTAEDAIRFLQSCGLILNDQKRLGVGLASIHVGSDSPLVSKHHLNWRIRAMESLDRARPNDLHYSSVISLSESDAEIIREQWVKAIQSSKKIIRDSPSETIRVFSLDFFEI